MQMKLRDVFIDNDDRIGRTFSKKYVPSMNNKLSGSDAASSLGQVSLSPMLEGEGSIPVRDIGFSPLICDTD